MAKEVFAEMVNSNEDPKSIVERKGLRQISDESALGKIIVDVLRRNVTQAEQYRSGNSKLLGYLVGEVMKASKGKANPALVNTLLRKYLDGTA